jgi:predicted RNase H-like HicB family nuclease
VRERRSLTQCSTDRSLLGHTRGRGRHDEWFIAYCAEIPGANGQGRTKEEALGSLSSAVALILEDRREDSLRGLPADAIQEKVTVK